MTKPGAVIVIPRGRSAAEKRISAIAALHSPQVVGAQSVHGIEIREPTLVCPECSSHARDRYGDRTWVRWPCATVRLLGPWPGEVPEVDGG